MTKRRRVFGLGALLDAGRASSPLRSLLTKGLWGGLDQMLLSATNFGTLVLVARAVSPSEFGSYSLVLTFVMFVLALEAGLLNRPYAVISASRHGRTYRQYVTSVAVAQVTSALAATLFLLLTGVALWLAGLQDAASLVAVAGPAIAAWGLQEFIRQVLYAEGRLQGALLNDAISYGLQMVALFGAALAGALTPVLALAIIAASSFVAVAAGVDQIRDSLSPRFDWPSFRGDSLENWRFGRWMAGGAALVGGMELANGSLLATFVSVAAAGALRAVTTVMGPTHILLKTMDITLTPMAARIVEREGAEGLRRFVRRMFLVTGPLMAGYCALVVVSAGPILKLLYGPEYAAYAWLLQIGSLTYLLSYFYKPVSIGVTALRESAPLFRAQLVQAILVLTVGAAATYSLGLQGSAITLALAAFAQNCVIWRAYLRKVDAGIPAAGLSAPIRPRREYDASRAH